MKQSTYAEIVDTIHSCPGLFSMNCPRYLMKRYPHISPNTLYSILAIECKNAMKRKYGKLMFCAAKYSEKYQTNLIDKNNTGVLLKVAEKADIPSALLIKHFLEKYYESKDQTVKSKLSKIINDPSLIEDKFLAFEIFLCVLYDHCYGPISVSIGHSIGEEYELKLRNYMIEHNVAFVDEEHLRSRGYDKTPDIKLEVPIAVGGVVINWIESKARFGSVEIHNEYMKSQYCAYWNRFGPGLIIYWFDFVDVLNHTEEKRFIVMNNLPTNIVHINFNDTRISFL